MELSRRHLHGRRFDELAANGRDIVFGHRQGPRVEDAHTGQWLWNCHSNGGTFNFGHRNPAVVAAVVEALEQVDIGNHHQPSPWRAVAAERLSETTGGTHPGVVFSTTGGEANDLAMQLAVLHTGRRRVVVAEGCFHGTTSATLATITKLARPLGLENADIVAVPWNDPDALASVLDERVGLVLLESIPATSGFPLPAPGYLATVSNLCTMNGSLLALDEVQTGLGRTGRIWSYQHDGVVPDMVITGKGLSGGIMPIAATLLSPALFDTWSNAPRFHVSTFGGNELACAAVIAVCDLLDDSLLEHVDLIAGRFRERLSRQRFGFHGRGLVMALRVDDQWGSWQRLRDAGVFTYPASFTTDTIQLKPALIVTAGDADDIIDAVLSALA